MQCSAPESLEWEDKRKVFSGFIVFLCTSDMFCIAFCYLFHKATALLLSIKYIPKRRKCVIQCSDLRGKLLGYFCCNVASSCFALLASLSHGVLLTESCLDKWVLLCCHAKLKAFSVWIFFFVQITSHCKLLTCLTSHLGSDQSGFLINIFINWNCLLLLFDPYLILNWREQIFYIVLLSLW